MNKERKLCLSSLMLQQDLINLTNKVVSFYYRELRPVLKSFSLLDDERIKRYLACDDMSEVYKDAEKENSEKFGFLESISDTISQDLWAAFRDSECYVKTPKEEGFVFAQMPLAYNPLKGKVLRCLVIKDGEVSESPEAIRKEALIYANERQTALYEVVEEFCDSINRNFAGWKPRELIYVDNSGLLRPYLGGIMKNTQFL